FGLNGSWLADSITYRSKHRHCCLKPPKDHNQLWPRTLLYLACHYSLILTSIIHTDRSDVHLVCSKHIANHPVQYNELYRFPSARRQLWHCITHPQRSAAHVRCWRYRNSDEARGWVGVQHDKR
ncbi:uncharacterized protein MYCFIDRAFT_212121, partial [Pseudocercospora fijiensis CIRAD86]